MKLQRFSYNTVIAAFVPLEITAAPPLPAVPVPDGSFPFYPGRRKSRCFSATEAFVAVERSDLPHRFCGSGLARTRLKIATA